VERLTEKVIGKVSDYARKKIVHAVVEQIQNSASSQTAHVIGQHVAHFTSTAVGSQIAVFAAHALMKVIASNIGPIVAKFLASAVFKKVIAALVHKFIVGIIASAVLKFLAAHIGVAIGASTIMWIILPIFAAILIKQIYDFPQKLGREVSASVRQHLDNNFQQVNRNILEETFERVFKGEELLKCVANDEGIQQILKSLGEKIINEV
jgi:hypothetical protein